MPYTTFTRDISTERLPNGVTDDQLERFNWYILIESVNGSKIRTLTSVNPKGD